MQDARAKGRRSPWSFVPTQYVLQGFNSFLVDVAANVYFAATKLPLGDIGRYSSDLALPFTLKALWSPLVDLFGTKRAWHLGSAAAVAIAAGLLAWSMQSAEAVRNVVLACLVLAIAGATNDIATDGYYLLALEKRQQELFVGVRSAAFRLGRVAIQGGAVWLAGALADEALGTRAVQRGFAMAFALCALLYALGTLWHALWLPRLAADGPARGKSGGWSALGRAVVEYFARPGIAGALAFILLYRVAETTLAKMIVPFLKGERERGGLGLTTEDVGLLYGTLGVLALLAGGILSGVWIARSGLRRAIWPAALAMHAPNVLFVWAAHAQVGRFGAGIVVVVEQFAYGLGFSAYMAALLVLSRGSRFATTHYAISTGLMGLSAWITGRFSGDLAERLGFEHFFWVVTALGFAGLATLPFFPHEARDASRERANG